jgi:hypothetical protein
MFFVEPQQKCAASTLFYTGVTDNQGNVALLAKASTSKFPLYLVHLELTMQLKFRNVSMDLRWQRRDENTAADSLTNLDFSKFNLAHRITPNISKMNFIVLPQLLESAILLDKQIRDRKVSLRTVAAKDAAKPRGAKRKLAGLKTTDPW